jgi:hypothetical protein
MTFFQFESDFVDALRCIPMSVRYKLDTCGVKLKLDAWNRFSPSDRQTLVDLPCQSTEEVQAYHDHLHQLIVQQTGIAATDLPIDANPAWLKELDVPDSVVQKATEMGQHVSLEQWRSLPPLQRFALIKLSRSSHENRNFIPAMQEFGLI